MSDAVNHIYPPEDRDTAYCGHVSTQRLPAIEGAGICPSCEAAAAKRGLPLYERTPSDHKLVRHGGLA